MQMRETLFVLLFILYFYLFFFEQTRHPYTVFFIGEPVLYKEGYENSNPIQEIVLLGDSILDNQQYADKSLYYFLSNDKDNYNYNIVMLARDNAVISNIYTQLSNGKIKNSPDTHIFLSVGGNNLLQLGENPPDSKILACFHEYKKLVEFILARYNKCSLNLLNLYYPTSIYYKDKYNTIDKWNDLLASLSKKATIIEISKVCYTNSDFVHMIEPSSNCSEKIASLIRFHSLRQ